MTHLLSPKVFNSTLKYATEKQLAQYLKLLKLSPATKRKFGFVDVAVEVEEVTVTELINIPRRATNTYKKTPMLYREDEGARFIVPGTYYHVHLEYILA